MKIKQRTILSLLFFLGILCILLVLFRSEIQIFKSTADETFACSEYPTDQYGIPSVRGSRQVVINDLTRKNESIYQQFTKYKNNPSQDNKLLVQSLLNDRKMNLKKVIKEAPDQAYSVILNDRSEGLADQTKTCAAQETTIEGTLSIEHSDNFETGDSSTFHKLELKNNEFVWLHPAHGSQLDLVSGMHVKVKGYRLDNEVIFDGSQDDSIQEVKTSTFIFPNLIKKAEAFSITPIGNQPTVVILANYRNSPLPIGITTSYANDVIFNSASAIYRDNSYGKTQLVGGIASVFGPVTMNMDAPTASCPYTTIISEAIKAADSQVDFRNYARLIVIKPSDSGCGGNNWGSIGQQSLSTADGTALMSWAQLNAYIDPSSLRHVALHEVGHGFGLQHAGFYNCGSTSFCSTAAEYEDRYDFMGRYIVSDGHTSALHKEKLGWWNTTGNLQTITTSGVYTLEPYETISTGIKALKIPRGKSDAFYIEYRTKTGVDSSLDTRQNVGTNVYSGALIHLRSTTTGVDSGVIDASPPTDMVTPALVVGQSLYDSINKILITTLSQTSSTLSVQVDLNATVPNTPTPTLTTPTSTPIPTNTPTPLPTNTPTPQPTNTPAPSTITPTPTTMKGDFNGSGSVDLLDFNLWRDEFSGVKTTKLSDGNRDGAVDLLDFNLWLTAFNGG